MPNEDHLNPAERELEEALGRLTPAAAGIDRDTLHFRAGLAAGRRRCWRWQASALTMSGVAAMAFVGLLWPRPTALVETPRAPQPEMVLVAQPTPHAVPPPIQARLVEARYLGLRQAILERGLDALPRATAGVGSGRDTRLLNDEAAGLPERYRRLLHEPDARRARRVGDGA
jgi:hypothetical protein